jgi:catechol 2,3-dioxygenase-like lactoylglutathione lyase family enzyme
MKPLLIFACRFLLLSCVLSPIAQARDQWDGIDRIVAIGDVHGDYEQYLQILRDNQLIDNDLNWQGGKTHLVQVGDVPDRGPDSLKIMRHLRQLEKQAKRDRGYVHALLGNHEAMNIQGDLRYVHPGEYQILVTDESATIQSRYIERVLAFEQQQPESPLATNPLLLAERRGQLQTLYPPGYVEHRILWAPRGEAFEWVKSNNTLIKLNRVLFVHGGLAPEEPMLTISKINKQVRKALREEPQNADTPGYILGDNGPLWYRGLANEAGDEDAIKMMLNFYDADTIVIAHTPTRGAVMPGENGHVIQVDVGLGQAYGRHRASLLIEAGKFYAVHRGQRIPLPRSDAELPGYLAQVLALEPDPAAIQKTIDELVLP